MNLQYGIAFLCVIGLSIGQILFKFSANAFAENGICVRALIYLCSALTIYMIQTLAWIWTLKYISIGKIYPVMAFAFILVPIGSMFLLKENFPRAIDRRFNDNRRHYYYHEISYSSTCCK